MATQHARKINSLLRLLKWSRYWLLHFKRKAARTVGFPAWETWKSHEDLYRAFWHSYLNELRALPLVSECR